MPTLVTDTTETEWAAFKDGNLLGVWHETHGFTDQRVIELVDHFFGPTAAIRRRTVRTVCGEWKNVPRLAEQACRIAPGGSDA